MTDPLSRYAILNGTDKYGYHDYTPNYHALLKPLREQPLRMLEIGVGGYGDPKAGGESLATWRDYFPNVTLVGIDIHAKELSLGDRVTILKGSAVDPDFIESLVEDHGPFDIILDDGSHRNEHVLDSFELLFPTLKAGGLYLVEDVQTAFFPRFGGSLDMKAPNTVGYFSDLAEALVLDRPLARDVASMQRFHNIIAVRKRSGILDPALPEPALLTGPNGAEEEALARTLDTIGDGQSVGVQCAEHMSPTLKRRFVEVDHREMRIHFPDAAISPLATSIRVVRVARGVVSLEKGVNDFPSNFDFDIDHPQVQEVLTDFREVLEHSPRVSGLLRLAELLLQNGRFDEAQPILDRLEEMDASPVQFFLMAARSKRRNGHWDENLALLERAYGLYPKRAEIAVQLGAAYLRARELDKAEEVLLLAREDHPRRFEVRLQLAHLYRRSKRHEDAVEEARTAVRLKPAAQSGWTVMARILLDADRHQEAEASIEAALSLNLESPALLELLSRSRHARGRKFAALDAIDRALELQPDLPRLVNWRKTVRGR